LIKALTPLPAGIAGRDLSDTPLTIVAIW